MLPGMQCWHGADGETMFPCKQMFLSGLQSFTGELFAENAFKACNNCAGILDKGRSLVLTTNVVIVITDLQLAVLMH